MKKLLTKDHIMFQIQRKNDKIFVRRNGKFLKVMKFDNECVLVKVAKDDLKEINYEQFPKGLQLGLRYEVFCSFVELTISKTDKGFCISSKNRLYDLNVDWFVSLDFYTNALQHLLCKYNIVNDIKIEKAKKWQNLTFTKEIDKNENLFNFIKEFISDLESVLEKLEQVMCFIANVFNDDVGMD